MNRVKEFRERRGFAVRTLAERVGVSERLLRALEADSSVATVEIGFKLAVALEAPFAELFGLDNEPGANIVFGRVESGADVVWNRVETSIESSRRDDSNGCVDSVFDDVSAKEVKSGDGGVEVISENAAVEESGVCVDDSDDALRKTALAAKKWAEKSLEIAAACLFDEELEEREGNKPGKIGGKSEDGEKSEVGQDRKNGAARKARAPRRSEIKSSPNSKTADAEGLASSPPELVDPTAGRPIRFFDLFCGIGGFRFAAERTLAKMRRDGVCALSCDFDPPAQTSYEANFGERPFGDVAELPSEAIPDFDLLFAGFPCQAFSIIGLRKGFADETKGSLFFQIARILHDKRPRAFVLENVRQLTTHDGGRTFETILRILQEELGYCVDWRILNALDCGLPQKRERVAIVGSLEPFEIAWPKPKTDGKTLADVLEPDFKVDKKHFASPEIAKRRKEAHSSQYFPAIWHENKSGNISSYPYSCALRAGASYNYLLVNGERRLTPREMLRLQGFPDSFKIAVSDAQIRKQAGNAAPVDLIERVLDRFLPLVFQQGKATGGLF